MMNLFISTVGFLLVACSLVIANIQLTLNPAPIKRTPGPGRRNAIEGKD